MTEFEKLGHALVEKNFFLFRKKLVNMNHGSFGTVPAEVAEEQYKIMLEQESCPEYWFKKGFFAYINNSRSLVSSLINADVADVVMVENASYAVNAILRSYPFKVRHR